MSGLTSSLGWESRYKRDVVMEERERSLKEMMAIFFSNFLRVCRFSGDFARLLRMYPASWDCFSQLPVLWLRMANMRSMNLKFPRHTFFTRSDLSVT